MLREGDRIVGVTVAGEAGDYEIRAKYGVVLACGGFPHDAKRIAKAYPHLARGGEHLSPTPVSNTGDGLDMAESAGASVDIRFADTSAWMPVSRVPYRNGEVGVFPHLLDRYKPGVIGVLKNGRRFTNESNSYHDVGAALIRACEGQRETAMWLICDKPTLAKYGLGYAKPSPVPLGPLLRNGYLLQGQTLAELAARAGIDPAGLETTVRDYNVGAVAGDDPAFGRGRTSFNRYLADPDNKPNPCVAPIASGPFYAVKIVMGDLGTFDGIKTGVNGEVAALRRLRDRRPLRRRQRPREHHGRQLSRRRHHARPQYDVRLHHRQRHSRQSRSQTMSPPIKPIVDHRIYTIRLRKMAEFIDVFDRLAMPVLLRTLGHPLGFWTTWVGPQNQFVHLWGYDSLADYERRSQARDADPDFPAYLKASEALIEAQETRLIRAVRLASFANPAPAK